MKKLKLILLLIFCQTFFSLNANPILRNSLTAEYNIFTYLTGTIGLGYHHQFKPNKAVNASLVLPIFARNLYPNSTWKYTIGYQVDYTSYFKSKVNRYAIGYRLAFFNTYHLENSYNSLYRKDGRVLNYASAKVSESLYIPYVALVFQKKISERFSAEVSCGASYLMWRLKYTDVELPSTAFTDPSIPYYKYEEGLEQYLYGHLGLKLIYNLKKGE